MQEALATVTDLATLMKKSFADESPELAQAELLLQMASAWARSYAQRVWPTTEHIPATKRDTVVGIILAGVRRELQNPKRVTSETYGPNSAAYSPCPPGFFTPEEIAYLQRCSVTGNWWVQSTYRDDPEESIGYVWATDFKAPIPMYAPGDPGYGSAYYR
ncbi:MAG: hypothetical protein A4E20_10825 [Nitrospira sp. SG-bin2]|uniref:hypothetical protein n=1 Tax=Nitrospira cf. moscoviensis SBR1015 TaxID=96242 RepID=UPI000A0A7983|nr:hypothetical protein [Nitrospira cf. moscoviensis SBR1015]OQW34505.1 MAG: hypothetical protein A4E20_10825 [Nitrospira sp. SG-bin2]